MDEATEFLAKLVPGIGPVPEVDPADLKSLWNMQSEAQARHDKPGAIALSFSLCQSACSPGANVAAVWYRSSMLAVLQHLSDAGGPALPGIQEGKPSDAFFKALAIVPMTGMQPGAPPRKGFPFDLQELVSLIQKEAG